MNILRKNGVAMNKGKAILHGGTLRTKDIGIFSICKKKENIKNLFCERIFSRNTKSYVRAIIFITKRRFTRGLAICYG